jgi:hypothetical protein
MTEKADEVTYKTWVNSGNVWGKRGGGIGGKGWKKGGWKWIKHLSRVDELFNLVDNLLRLGICG